MLLQTSQGEITIDLHVDLAPRTCKNFLKLCKRARRRRPPAVPSPPPCRARARLPAHALCGGVPPPNPRVKYYNNCMFHNIQPAFIAQTGDPTGSGKGGDSVSGLLYGEQARFIEDEITPLLKHRKAGTVGMASAGENANASQFYMTLRDELDTLDEKKTIFGQVSEGLDVLQRIGEAYCDSSGRPWVNIRILHTFVLDDPFDDPPGLGALVPESSPELVKDPGDDRLEDGWKPEHEGRDPEEVEREIRRKEAGFWGGL